MLSSLRKLESSDLEEICDLGDYHELKTYLNETITRKEKDGVPGKKLNADDVFAEIKNANPSIESLYRKRSIFSRAFANALADSQNFPMLVLPAFLGIASLAPTTLAMIGNALGLILLGSGGIYFGGNYTEYQKDDKHDTNDLIFSLAQMCCANILLERDKKKLVEKNIDSQPLVPNPSDVLKKVIQKFTHYQRANPEKQTDQPSDYTKKSKLPRAKTWLSAMFPVTMATFSIYTFGYGALAGIFGLSTAIALGPIGLAAAAGASLGIGMFFGYKAYHADRNSELAHKIHRQIEIKFGKLRSQHIKNKIAIKKNAQATEEKQIIPETETQNIKKNISLIPNLSDNKNSFYQAKNDGLQLTVDTPHPTRVARRVRVSTVVGIKYSHHHSSACWRISAIMLKLDTITTSTGRIILE